MLRVDDLDTYRVREEYVQFIFEALPFFGISWQIGPRSAADLAAQWSQKHRLKQYNHCIERLQRDGHLFACTCSRKQMRLSVASSGCVGDCKQSTLQDPGLPHAFRLKTGGDPQSFLTLDGPESTLHPDPEMKDFVVRRKDGLPAYQIASLMDDLHFGPWGIVRGSDLLPSTWAQLQLASLLREQAFACIHFVHHGLIDRADEELPNEKLSKSHAAPALQLTSSARTELKEEYLVWKRKEKAAAYLDRSRGSMRA